MYFKWIIKLKSNLKRKERIRSEKSFIKWILKRGGLIKLLDNNILLNLYKQRVALITEHQNINY